MEEEGEGAPEAHAFLGPVWGVFGGSGLRLDWSIQTQKSRIWVSSMGSYQREGPERQGDLIRRTEGEVISGTYICDDSATCYLGVRLPDGANVGLRPLQAIWPNKWMSR